MRPKIGLLEEAFAGLKVGTFGEHHRLLLTRMLARVDAADTDTAALDAQIETHLVPFADAVARLDEIPGVGPVAAAVIIAEIGTDMTRFPTPGHLCSWARFAPGIKSSAGKTKGNGSSGHGDKYLARVLGEAAVGAGRTDTFLGPGIGASCVAVDRRRPLSPSGAPSWSSSGTYSPTHRHASKTSDPTAETARPPPWPGSAATSAGSKPSATASPSNPPPD
jgi:hypothetical protein